MNKFTDVALVHVNKEVKAGRYSTTDVQKWLYDYGYLDISLVDSKNLRYKIMKDLPFKG